MTQKEKIEQLEKEIFILKDEITKMRQNREHFNKITDTEITLTDTLNDDDMYVIKIMSGNLFIEKVGE